MSVICLKVMLAGEKDILRQLKEKDFLSNRLETC